MSVLDEIRKLDEQREKLLNQAKQQALKAVDKAIQELNALGFNYKLVESGGGSAGSSTRRRTGIRKEVLALIKSRPNGISPADIKQEMGADDKSSQQSISNALAALKKAKSVSVVDGLYKAVA